MRVNSKSTPLVANLKEVRRVCCSSLSSFRLMPIASLPLIWPIWVAEAKMQLQEIEAFEFLSQCLGKGLMFITLTSILTSLRSTPSLWTAPTRTSRSGRAGSTPRASSSGWPPRKTRLLERVFGRRPMGVLWQTWESWRTPATRRESNTKFFFVLLHPRVVPAGPYAHGKFMKGVSNTAWVESRP